MRLVHITLEKSGSQWVRDVLTSPEVVHHSGLTNANLTFNANTVGPIHFPCNKVSGPIYNLNKAEWNFIRQKDDYSLVVVRDPRDRLISFLFSLIYSHGTDVYNQYGKEVLTPLSIDDQIKSLILGVLANNRFYLTWMLEPQDEYQRLVKYEDLIANEQECFQSIFKWLHIDISPGILSGVIERLSFKNRSGRNPGENDVYSHYRMGTNGDWKNYFSKAHGKMWEDLAPGFLRSIGYELNDNWWESLPEKNSSLQGFPDSQFEPLKRRIVFLEGELELKKNEIQTLAQACQERLDLIVNLDLQLKKFNK